ncbi:hypothetical protein GTO27_13370 [Candidatus Bathyarchaeota archaeon]|nr:hypothetical protein [Candidatus Bathyarchaeota archaeon]
MADFKTQLASLLTEGNSIAQSVESTAFMLSLGKAVAPHVLEEEELEDFEEFIETLDLPSPVHQVYVRYIKWNRDCESFFRNLGLSKSFQFREFVRLRKEVSRESSKKSPYQRKILLKISEQLSVLDSLYKLNLERLGKEAKKPRAIPQSRKQRKRKLFLTLFYLIGCILVDIILFPIITLYVIGLIAAEATILFGIPKLLEWLSES